MDLSKLLPTLAEVEAARRGAPILKGASRLELKAAKDQDDKQQLEQWRRAVRERDKRRCRVCGVKTIQTLAMKSKRGEAHHLAGRADKAVRYDVRNGLHVCLRHHGKFKAGTLFVFQPTADQFQVAGKTYLDASKPLVFKESR